jgi:hypothetical protein
MIRPLTSSAYHEHTPEYSGKNLRSAFGRLLRLEAASPNVVSTRLTGACAIAAVNRTEKEVKAGGSGSIASRGSHRQRA